MFFADYAETGVHLPDLVVQEDSLSGQRVLLEAEMIDQDSLFWLSGQLLVGHLYSDIYGRVGFHKLLPPC